MAESFDELKEVQTFIRSQLVETGVPSIAVAVARKGEVLWEQGFGWANREDRIPATEHSLYSMASISKPITATGLIVLRDKGLIDIDRPVNDYLGDAKVKARVGNADDATVRRVAEHTAGLPLHYHWFYEDEPDGSPHMGESIRRYGNLVTPPGEKFQYSNHGYGILDYVISRVAGQSFPDFMRQEVFIPLNMLHSSIGIAPGLEQYQTMRYSPSGRPLPIFDVDHPGASAVLCSAHDLIRFGMFHLKDHLTDQKAIIRDEYLDEMQVPAIQINPGFLYGFGWFVYENYDGYPAVAHGGGMDGVSTQLLLVPSEDVAMVALANTRTTLVRDVIEKMLAVVMPEFAGNRESREAAEKGEDSESSFAPTPDLLGSWAGSVHIYNDQVPFALEFHEDGDVHARLGDQLKNLVNDASLKEGNFKGRMLGNIGTEEADRYPHEVLLDLNIRQGTLNGCLTSKGLSDE